MTKLWFKRIISFGLIAGFELTGCSVQETILKNDSLGLNRKQAFMNALSGHENYPMELVTQDGTRYRFESGWRVDALGRVFGQGSCEQVEPSKCATAFSGYIASEDIENVKVWRIDELKTGANIVGVGVAVFGIMELVRFVKGFEGFTFQPRLNLRF